MGEDDLRERVARAVDPEAWANLAVAEADTLGLYSEYWRQRRQTSLKRADAVIALVGEECANVARDRLKFMSCTCAFAVDDALRALTGGKG